ncbi:conserved Plasmodium protein, unknown function [Plasmodium berghei]|uniref:Uncharacterized protein n=2 Tax=Plasmodium berghei TaxID=5821 RepID=A0A509APQ7_PLABA|nr:conserved Plasmodium protein, unknown function [Plasmodium berghei ANKA]SCM24262.1 conserved Plasmodium protein, unknown function [Plasmodium berghei]SCN27044.1 conserved Plasmodium protein, unknown function [Plasmodium berghei]SCO61489.1 conserved Plasmodium protein, unknown function [Plasmodium berghei]SCO63467.1 conserved Plasmodium protein, unknown function [Plasmodium berghei]VUC56875.1 conserved Plasmodium protein, unknown function [Plasmodium berghei ANKA]|eukprot:XP_034422661.1 conserved Plasmodium protein, unknown function [Plasmodium berghei ANKA]
MIKTFKKAVYYFILNFICTCFKVHKIKTSNKIDLFPFPPKQFVDITHKARSNIYNSCNSNDAAANQHLKSISQACGQNDESESEIRKKIEEERKRQEQIKRENSLFINSDFKYLSNSIPINVEKRYAYDAFKYTSEILAYIFFVINLFKHEQFKNKIYKEFLEHQETQIVTKNSYSEENQLFNKNDTLNERNKKLVKNFIRKFGDKFKFFNIYEKVQREDWATMFKMEQDDKNNFFKSVKIKNETTKEYYFVIYYCNWKYDCMALYNALHNIFKNSYNDINFYKISNNIYENDEYTDYDSEQNEKGKKENEELLSKSVIDQIKDMYIKDIKNNKVMDIDSVLNNENAENIIEMQTDEDQTSKNNENDQNNAQTTESKNSIEGDNTKKTFQEIMVEEKKKLDEEFFLYGYSKYEDLEQIKKEESMIKETKDIIKEEKMSKYVLNNKKDFKNILNDFPLHIKDYKDYYKFDDGNKEYISPQKDLTNFPSDAADSPNNSSDLSTTSSASNISDDIKNKNKTQVNVNVIFIRLSNSTVIGKTKNIKKKIKKKWIYSHEKEIKFYEQILSVMLNENIYYKDIPYMDIFSISYDKKNIYDFFNKVNTNLKHCFIHKNNVYDIYNNVINGTMDIYNFDIYDTNSNINKDKDYENAQYSHCNHNELLSKNIVQENDQAKNAIQLELEQNNHITFEELSLDEEIENIQNYETVYDGSISNFNASTKKVENMPNNTNYIELLNSKNSGININQNHRVKIKKKKKSNGNQYKLIKKEKHNKKQKSKYEILFKQKYTNIFANRIKDKISIDKITSISNVHDHANYTVDTFRDYSISHIFKNLLTHESFKVDKNYVYYLNYKIPKEIFPFILQMSLAYKYEYTTLMINAPKKVEFEFRNV